MGCSSLHLGWSFFLIPSGTHQQHIQNDTSLMPRVFLTVLKLSIQVYHHKYVIHIYHDCRFCIFFKTCFRLSHLNFLFLSNAIYDLSHSQPFYRVHLRPSACQIFFPNHNLLCYIYFILHIHIRYLYYNS